MEEQDRINFPMGDTKVQCILFFVILTDHPAFCQQLRKGGMLRPRIKAGKLEIFGLGEWNFFIHLSPHYNIITKALHTGVSHAQAATTTVW